MSLAQFDGDFAFCEPVTAHKETFVEVQEAGLTPADLPAVGEYLTPEATFNVFPKEVGVFLSPTVAAATVLLPPTAQATVQFLPLGLPWVVGTSSGHTRQPSKLLVLSHSIAPFVRQRLTQPQTSGQLTRPIFNRLATERCSCASPRWHYTPQF